MSKSLRLALLLTLICLGFFILRLPAAIPARFLPANIALAGLEGSIWQGHASALGVNGIVAQEKLAWSFQPARIFKGQLVWQVSSMHAGRAGKLELVLGPRTAAIEKLQLSLPIEPLTQLEPTLAGLRLRGVLSLESERLARAADLQIKGRLENISSAMASETTALGSYEFNATANPAGVGALSVAPLGGALQISGGGAFDLAKEKFDINLRLKPETDLPGLSPVLATLPRDQGSYLLKYPR